MKREWEKEIEGKELPKLETFVDFLISKCRLLENMNYGNKFSKQSSRYCDRQERAYVHVTTNKPNCAFCKDTHFIYSCQGFLEFAPRARYDEIKRTKHVQIALNPDISIANANQLLAENAEVSPQPLASRQFYA
ncbi:hypothetical protein ILUMI_19265 [Ignelater luminosus]|uniref:Uncharacterized protein n=1 Tax=Ignelater luminosus TaxID=2038154 RepID=A0A8K0CKI5_IGNLU|nr:hypothetical protein ILUMI_19265 [Ignelater luminosus]